MFDARINSIAGSILENYDLLLNTDVHIIGEVYLRIAHQLMALPGTELKGVMPALLFLEGIAKENNGGVAALGHGHGLQSLQRGVLEENPPAKGHLKITNYEH